ncbi:hypothetical protein N431DRAFT_450013 [Stipitochalara longipes BDJ]|nr:hypothetical protein N431DRAFT_450013 [Stipitochalara longipes BDJ]
MSVAEAGVTIASDNIFPVARVGKLATSTKSPALDSSLGHDCDLIFSEPDKHQQITNASNDSWGDTLAMRPITVNDAEYYGTSNLKNALEQFYRLGRRRIKDMHNVYAEAEVVVAYIGDVVETEAEEVRTLVTAGYPFNKAQDSEAVRRFFDQPFGRECGSFKKLRLRGEYSWAMEASLLHGTTP